ncbi:Cullin [Gracilaria domingensis]|nr:Cullin [Gracilaria domingensis]
MALFRYLSDKDVFERYYKQHLQKRLLYSRSTSSDAERSFITKMKTDCGYLYTSKMEIMFNDMKTSDESTSQFREKVAQESIEMRGIDLRVFVLTTMSWPVKPAPTVNLPEDAVHCTSKFEEFYYQKHNGRRLTWQQSLGTAEIRARFGARVYDLYSVSAYAMSILLLFNSNDSLTYKEIADATLIPESELIRHLQSLSLAKHKFLKKEPREKEVKPDDRFIFNSDFQSRSRRIKMQVVTAQKENETERSQTRCRITADRGPVIDTVIVRIMKHRKTLEHNRLIAEVTRELESKFEPNTQEIKKRIESLVEREYLERHKDKRQVYQYVA